MNIPNDDFIRKIITDDLRKKKISQVHTRFPPEPNGYLHIGHAKSIALNFGIAKEFSGLCNIRFDDTNPEKENTDYVESIKRDIQWLGYTWDDREYYASDYFERFYGFAVTLVKKNLAYVDHLSPEEIKHMRGTPTIVGSESPYRSRTVEENLRYLEMMQQGKCKEGECLLRAKIDMAHPNLIMRDPAIYRIRYATHHRTKNMWSIYPLYDFAHCLSDAIEGITHSLCTLEFEIHRPLYDWFINAVGIHTPHPVQIEFARLNLTHTVLSKRKMKMLVDHGLVSGWDDPRLATLSGLRRRGYLPESIKKFCAEIGVTKVNSTLDLSRFEEVARHDLNAKAIRIMAVIDPIKLIITNYPEDTHETFEAENNPEDADAGTHVVPFSRELYIEREDFREDPPKGYFRLSPGAEVRLKYAYYITCTQVIKNHNGDISEIHAVYDPRSRGGWTDDGRKVRGTLHWVSVPHSEDIQAHYFATLFIDPYPEQLEGDEFLARTNKDSLVQILGVKAEPYITEIIHPCALQFLRKGYFIFDQKSSDMQGQQVFNRVVSLKDTWQKRSRAPFP